MTDWKGDKRRVGWGYNLPQPAWTSGVFAQQANGCFQAPENAFGIAVDHKRNVVVVIVNIGAPNELPLGGQVVQSGF